MANYWGANLFRAKQGSLITKPTADHTAIFWKRYIATAGAAVTTMSIVEKQADGKWDDADASSGGATGELAFMMHDKGTALVDTDVCYAITEGVIVDVTWNFTPGADVFVSNVAGEVSDNITWVDGDTKRKVGYALDADTLVLKISDVWHTMEDDFIPAQSTMATQQYAAKNITDATSRRITFRVPINAVEIIAITAVIKPGATAATWDIDLDSDYGKVGESYITHSEAEAAATYNLTNAIFAEIDLLTTVLTSVEAGDIVGIQLTNNHGTGGVISLMGIGLKYFR